MGLLFHGFQLVTMARRLPNQQNVARGWVQKGEDPPGLHVKFISQTKGTLFGLHVKFISQTKGTLFGPNTWLLF